MRRRYRYVLLAAGVACFTGGVTNVFGQMADDLWKTMMLKATTQQSSRDYAKAEQNFGLAMREAEHFGNEDTRVVTTLKAQGDLYMEETKFADAEAAFRRALTIVENSSQEDSPDRAEANLNLARALIGLGHGAAAIPLAAKAVGVYQSTYGGFDTRTATAHCALGDGYRLESRYAQAEQELKNCADVRERTAGVQNPLLAEAMHSLGLLYAAQAKYALAEPRLRLAEKIREKALGITSPLLAQTMEDHAAVLRKMGRDQEAAKLTSMSATIRKMAKR